MLVHVTAAMNGSLTCLARCTVVGLLQRYYDPSSGFIHIDGKDLRNLDIKHHRYARLLQSLLSFSAPRLLKLTFNRRRRIGIVTQDPILFKGTILSNLIYGCPSASRADAIEAARMANALDFINSFPDGMETECGERGVQLSGGYVISVSRP
jgi:ABC-type multidrug transport system fused ATPase/permease subunit